MKFLFCSNKSADVNNHLAPLIQTYFPTNLTVVFDLDHSKPKESLLSYLEGQEISDDEYVIFIPPGNAFAEDRPDYSFLQCLIDKARELDLAYIRLQKIGVHKDLPLDNALNLKQEQTDVFHMVPHLIRYKDLKEIVAKGSKHAHFFWISLETYKKKGAYFFNAADADNKALSYWKSGGVNMFPIDPKIGCCS